jgi:hypothetical protein
MHDAPLKLFSGAIYLFWNSKNSSLQGDDCATSVLAGDAGRNLPLRGFLRMAI